MLIGIDASRSVTKERTGTEAYAYYLINAFIPLAQERNHHIRLYFNQPPNNQRDYSNQIDLQIIPFPRLWTHVRLSYELYRSPPDLFFTPSHVIPYHYKGKSIATIHDLGYYHFPEAHPKKQRRLLDWGTRLNSNNSSAIVADSEATKTDLIDIYKIKEKKINVIYPGLPPVERMKDHEKRVESLKNRYQINNRYFFYVGTIQPRKNLIRLINAYRVVAEKRKIDLVLAGKLGWYAEEIINHIAKLPHEIQSRIHLIGFITEEEKSTLFSNAVALLFPSLYEGFGFPILEAQQNSCPVITSNSSSLPEVAGKAALFVDPLQTDQIVAAMEQLLMNEQIGQTLISDGRENLVRFSWEKTAAHLLALMEKVAND